MANFVSSETFAVSEIIFARRLPLARAAADSSQDICLGPGQDVTSCAANRPTERRSSRIYAAPDNGI